MEDATYKLKSTVREASIFETAAAEAGRKARLAWGEQIAVRYLGHRRAATLTETQLRQISFNAATLLISPSLIPLKGSVEAVKSLPQPSDYFAKTGIALDTAP